MATLMLACSYLAGAAQIIVYYFLLPDTIATHFNASGAPDSWGGKTAYTLAMLLVLTCMSLLWPLIAIVLKKVPVRFISMPNREYWFSEERRELTVSMIAKYLSLMGASTNVLLIAVNFLTFSANTHADVRLNTLHTTVALGLYFAVLALIIVAMIVRFRKRDA